ncbi:hypothetical protein VTL71DRAFT_1961 [Oculimacula yallundae]|uniref:Uncharacterized protein n=1 Tax=Oculimacula yallundae TaxID=86028 RepID=A0ABR4CDK2_9HELO
MANRKSDLRSASGLAEKSPEFIAEAKASPFLPVDPNTLEGQMTGAILAIKNKPVSEFLGSEGFEVGDCVQVDGGPGRNDGKTVRATNLRTGKVSHIIWSSVFPVGEREVCRCYSMGKATCRCVYVDFEKSRASNPKARRSDHGLLL